MNLHTPENFLNSPHPGSLVKNLDRKSIHPVMAFERIARPPYAFLMESVKGSPSTGRYSFVGTDPFLVLKTKGRRVEIHREGRSEIIQETPLTALRNILAEISVPKPKDLPPFFGGGVGLFGYDLVRFFERLPVLAKDDLDCPDLLLMFVDTVLVFDREDNSARIIYTPPGNRVRDTDRKTLLEEGLSKIVHLEERLAAPSEAPPGGKEPEERVKPESNFTKKTYIQAVTRCKEHIAAGDIYQANLSQRFSVPFHRDPWSLYKALREINPSPFAGFMLLDDLTLVSASPERLIRMKDGILETRPIAGTRPRGNDSKEDERQTLDLLTSPKERAEHLMLVDLERNDLGRVCRFGNVRVDEFMVTEQYSHVIHIVSNIRGELALGQDCLDVIRAVFPGGTITGVPKVRCMQIIEELEPVVRGPYTGSFGYINLAGEMDLNLIIRTFVIKNGHAYIQVGGGIVADSVPEREYEETLYKAEGLFRALEGMG